MHTGSRPSATRSTQRSHFCMTPSAPMRGTPHGQAMAHPWQPIQSRRRADDRRLPAALQRRGGARQHARCVLAVHADERDVAQARLRVRAALDGEHRAPGHGCLGRLKVVLIHAGDRAGVAAGAAVDVEVEGVAGRCTFAPPRYLRYVGY
jgi:hypothetical protein